MNPDQTNTKRGGFPVLAGEDLTGKRSRLVVLTHDAGVPEVKLPAANTDYAPYLLNEEGVDTALVEVDPLTTEKQVRVVLKGTCNPGDPLVLADVATPADKGKLRKLPVAAGTYRVVAIAEEAGVDTQHLKCRPSAIGNIVVP